MPKLVNVDELIERVYREQLDNRELIAQMIKSISTIDAEPVIRCKDCKYAYMTYDGECKYCDVWEAEGEMYLDGDFYCAFGKRKEDETND